MTLPASLFVLTLPAVLCLLQYASPTSVNARFGALSFHTFSTETAHCPTSGRLQMRCAIASDKGRAAASRAPHRYVGAASLSAWVGGADAVATPRMPRGGGVSAAMPSERFGLYVDGQYYGPFAHATIQPCTAPGHSEPLSLPVRTFFPIEAAVNS
jgi:hypothetical protein